MENIEPAQVPDQDSSQELGVEDLEAAAQQLQLSFSQEEINVVGQLRFTDVNEAIDLLMRIHTEGVTQCPICLEALADRGSAVVVDCAHSVCRPCMQSYLQIKIEEGQVLEILCPYDECRSKLSEEFITSFLSDQHQTMFAKFLRIDQLNSNPNLRWCPQPDCEGYSLGSMHQTKLACNQCSHEYCYYCGEAVQQQKKHKCKGVHDKKLDKWSRKNGIKICPNCKRRVQKLDGCDHMTCPKCKYEWCWLCGQRFHSGHFEDCEYKRRKFFNMPWSRILAMVFAPVLFPFTLVILGCMNLYKINHEGEVGCFYDFLRIGWLSYPLTVLLMLLVTPFAGLVLPFVAAYEFLDKIKPSSGRCPEELLRAFGSFFLGLLVPIGVVIALCILHILGMIFLVCKLYIHLRKCIDPSYMSFALYANF